jgi:hypothetical protein
LIAEKRTRDGKDYVLLSNTGDFIQSLAHVTLPNVKFLSPIAITIHFDVIDRYIYIIETVEYETSSIDVYKLNTDGETYSFVTTIKNLDPTLYISLIKKVIVLEHRGLLVRSLDIDFGDDECNYPGPRYAHVQDEDDSIVDLDRKQICCQTESYLENDTITIIPVKRGPRHGAEGGQVFTLALKRQFFYSNETPVFIQRIDEGTLIEAKPYLLCYNTVSLTSVWCEKVAIVNNATDTIWYFDLEQTYVPKWIIKIEEKTITNPVVNSSGTFGLVGGKQIIDLHTSEIVFNHKEKISEFAFNLSGTVLYILVPLMSSDIVNDSSKSNQRRTRLEVYTRKPGSSMAEWHLYDDHTINSSSRYMTAADSLMVFTATIVLRSIHLMIYDLKGKRIIYGKQLSHYLGYKMFHYIHLINDGLLSISGGQLASRAAISIGGMITKPGPDVKNNELHFDWPDNTDDCASVKPAESRTGNFIASAELEPNRLRIWRWDDKRCLCNLSENDPLLGNYFSSAGAILFLTFTFNEQYLLVLLEHPDYHLEVLIISVNMNNEQNNNIRHFPLIETKTSVLEKYALIGCANDEDKFIVYRVMPPAKSGRVYSLRTGAPLREIIFTHKEKSNV